MIVGRKQYTQSNQLGETERERERDRQTERERERKRERERGCLEQSFRFWIKPMCGSRVHCIMSYYSVYGFSMVIKFIMVFLPVSTVSRFSHFLYLKNT